MLQLWQAFVGVKARRVEKYYQHLLTPENDFESKIDQQSMQPTDSNGKTNADSSCVTEKWKGQIEKVFLYFIFDILSSLLLVSFIFFLSDCGVTQLTVFCLCRICLEHSLVILLWIRMVEML